MSTQEPQLSNLFLEVTIKIIWYIVLIYLIYLGTTRFDRVNQKSMYIIWFILMIIIAYIMGRMLHTKDMYGKEGQERHVIIALVGFIVFAIFAKNLLKMI